MKVEKKQLPQLVVLGVLVILCIGFVSFQIAGSKKSPRSAAAPSKTEAVKVVEKQETEEPQQLAVIPDVFPNLQSTPVRRDPFVSAKLPGSVREEAKAVRQQTVRTNTNQIRTAFNTAGKVPPFNPFRNISQDAGPSLQPVPQVREDPEPQFTLTGVIRGSDENVAIIRTGDNGRYVVKQGQYIEGRYKVLYITTDSAVLAYKNRRIHVKLGGDNNAS